MGDDLGVKEQLNVVLMYHFEDIAEIVHVEFEDITDSVDGCCFAASQTNSSFNTSV